jgi:hypothetical protein
VSLIYFLLYLRIESGTEIIISQTGIKIPEKGYRAYPPVQIQSVPSELPAGEIELVQLVHVLAVVAATAVEKVFGGQSWHAEASNVSLYVPGAHGTHAPLLSSNPEPISHFVMHCSTLFAPVSSVISVPGHAVQSAEPLTSLYVFRGQFSHVFSEAAATAEPKVPAVHCLHSLSPTTSAKLPDKQASQTISTYAR